ncbi:LuxR family transcriptional regulator [Variovorax gossypii]|uniref:LuxR family transcriptional regulator n=1 Tax=Variovorax gossypii TaxID=1679495 RepID=A0A3S0QD86_9BURK|nr:HD domain-containing phosphohydrolase [Variovorax gossypii]RTQ37364.1 LuxR family transcriptional regulator [Variovorax gossypii]
MQPSSSIRVFDAIRALAFVGDLSMGQPIDHSVRTGWLASRLAAAIGRDAATQGHVVCVALLRWSGCTANALEFSDLLGDDVGGRRTMLATASARAAADFASSVSPLAEIHCEVSGDIARTLGMPAAVELPLRHIFETFDGTGKPEGLDASRIPAEVFLVTIAGDLEIFSRVHGLNNALRYIAERADARYPAFLVDAVREHAVDWLHVLEQGAAAEPQPPSAALRDATAPLELIADVIDLKLPWMTGYSRKVAEAALHCARGMGLGDEQQQRIYRAGLIHGIGRASVPNAVWDSPHARSEADAERLRLVPYWTERAARRIDTLRAEAEIASFVDERLDGSGFFRGARGAAIDAEARALAAAAHWVALCTSRPGRSALPQAEALAALHAEGDASRLDPQAIAALTGQPQSATASAQPSGEASALLSGREVEVLGRISLGESNKEAARSLGISPSTVRAHLENIFRKLGCTTRAAATLKAMTLGLL